MTQYIQSQESDEPSEWIMLYENHSAQKAVYILVHKHNFTYFRWCGVKVPTVGINNAILSRWFLWLCAFVTVRVTCPHPFNSNSDLFEKSDDILAHMSQTDNDIVVVDVAESGVVSALPPGLVQDQIPAVHSGQEILVLSEKVKRRRFETIEPGSLSWIHKDKYNNQ